MLISSNLNRGSWVPLGKLLHVASAIVNKQPQLAVNLLELNTDLLLVGESAWGCACVSVFVCVCVVLGQWRQGASEFCMAP